MQCLRRMAARRLGRGGPFPCASKDVKTTEALCSRSPTALYPAKARHELLRPGRRTIHTTPLSACESKPSATPPTAAATSDSETAPTPAKVLASLGGPESLTLYDVDLYFDENEVLQPVPVDRLITPSSSRPYLFPDLGRGLFRNGLLLPFLSHRHNASTKGLFRMPGNIGVIREINAFAFKDKFPVVGEVLPEDVRRENYQEARDFIIARFERKYGKGVIQTLDGLKDVCKMIDASPLDEEGIVNHAVFLPQESTLIVIRRMHEFLTKVVLIQKKHLLSKANKRNKIYSRMPYCDSKTSWVTTALGHLVLCNWIDNKWSGQRPALSGKGLVLLHRHGLLAHSVEKDIAEAIKNLPRVQKKALAKNPYTRQDVYNLYDDTFPKFVFQTVKQFKKEGLESELGVCDLFHIPTQMVLRCIWPTEQK